MSVGRTVKTCEKKLILLSGGVDSSTLLYDLVRDGNEMVALTFNFGEQEAPNEKRHAERMCQELGVEHHYFDFSDSLRIFFDTPHPQFLRMAPGFSIDPRKSDTLQPFGSALALLLAASWAVRHGMSDIFYAVQANDSGFPDNHEEYFRLLGDLTSECEGEEFRITFHTPYLNVSKADVIRRGIELGVDYGETWSCGYGEQEPCGKCAPCVDRAFSFEVAGLTDPAIQRQKVEV